jgi:gluconokinase
MKCFLGVDIGTGSVKAIALSETGQVLANESCAYPTLQPFPGYSEQDPEVILHAVRQIITGLLSSIKEHQPISICFSAAMHSFIAVDENGKALTPALIWSDTRSHKEAKQLKEKGLSWDIYSKTGTPVHPMSPLCKLLWLKKNQPGIFASAHKFIGIKEYVLFHFTGEFVIDHSVASATGLFDFEKKDWYAPALELTGINASRLSNHLPVDSLLQWNTSFIKDFSAFDQVKLIVGSSDGCLANLGSGVMEKNKLSITIGTSAAVRITSAVPVIVQDQSLFNYILDEKYFISGGASNNGTVIFNYFTSWLGLAPGEPAAFLEKAFTAPAGCDGLVVLPYFLGERAPVWDADARAVISGWKFTHDPSYFMRALIEGVTMNLLDIFEKFPGRNEVEKIVASGGFIRSEKWLQLLADLFQLPVEANPIADASCLGAAIMGAKACGHEMVAEEQPVKRFIQDAALSSIYQKNYSIFRELYKKNKR